jgi:hypothetical protein
MQILDVAGVVYAPFHLQAVTNSCIGYRLGYGVHLRVPFNFFNMSPLQGLWTKHDAVFIQGQDLTVKMIKGLV